MIELTGSASLSPMRIQSRASLILSFPSRTLNKNPPHSFGGCREKMPSIIPTLRLLNINEPQICLMHQRRSLQRLAGLFVGHSLCGQLPQLLVDQRQELVGGLWVARLDLR